MKKLKQSLAIFLTVVMVLSISSFLGIESIFSPKADASSDSMAELVGAKSVGDLIIFGSYPQTDVTKTMYLELMTVAPSIDNWHSYNYYESDGQNTHSGTQSDFMKYYDVTYNGNRYRGVYFSKYRVDSCYLTSGVTHYQDKNNYVSGLVYWFRYDPIVWRVLDPATGYVISEIILDSQAFSNECYEKNNLNNNTLPHYTDRTYQHYANDWEYSTIRKWLNENFYTTAFSTIERSQIPKSKITTKNSGVNNRVFETNDYIFLPSYQDMVNTAYGFSSNYGSNSSEGDIERRTHCTDYAKSQGIGPAYSNTTPARYDKYNKPSYKYILRSVNNSTKAPIGMIDVSGNVAASYLIDYNAYGIRPALYFNPSSTICGNNHTPVKITGSPATCTSTGLTDGVVCSECNKIMTTQSVIQKTAHYYTEVIESTPSTCVTLGSRLMKCKNCDSTANVAISEYGDHSWNDGEVISNATCVDTGIKKFTCTTCAATKNDTIAIESANHKNIVDDAAVESTCTATGLTAGKHCAACDMVIIAQTETEKNSHEYTILVGAVPSTCVTLGYNVMKCASCDATTNVTLTEYVDHTWNDGEITTDANCVDTGVKTFTCTVCDNTREEIVAVNIHNHKTVVTVHGNTASCTAEGLTEGKICSACDAVILAQTIIPVKTHEFGEWTVVAEATKETEGKKTRICSDCGLKETKVIPKLDSSDDNTEQLSAWQLFIASLRNFFRLILKLFSFSYS